MSLQPWQGGQSWQSGQAAMRASHADRERAVDVLKAAYAEGRLNPAEYEQRIARAYQSQTYGELSLLISDLPQGPVPVPAPPMMSPIPQTFRPPPRSTNGLAVGALICGLAQPLTFGVSALPAVILGHIAKGQIKQTREEGDGLATTGLVLGWFGVGIWATFFFIAVVSGI